MKANTPLTAESCAPTALHADQLGSGGPDAAAVVAHAQNMSCAGTPPARFQSGTLLAESHKVKPQEQQAPCKKRKLLPSSDLSKQQFSLAQTASSASAVRQQGNTNRGMPVTQFLSGQSTSCPLGDSQQNLKQTSEPGVPAAVTQVAPVQKPPTTTTTAKKPRRRLVQSVLPMAGGSKNLPPKEDQHHSAGQKVYASNEDQVTPAASTNHTDVAAPVQQKGKGAKKVGKLSKWVHAVAALVLCQIPCSICICCHCAVVFQITSFL